MHARVVESMQEVLKEKQGYHHQKQAFSIGQP